MPPVRLIEAVLRLKETKRRGWLERDVPEPESVASHSYGLAVLALLTARERGLDALKAVTIALMHDLAESVTGDLTPEMKEARGREASEKAEQEILEQLTMDLPEAQRSWLQSLIAEYYEGSTPEAGIVRQLDKLEMALQAAWYSASNRLGKREASEFIQSSMREISDPQLRRWVVKLLKHLKSD